MLELDFIRNSFKKCFVVILWICLIGFIISGMIIGWNFDHFGASMLGFSSSLGKIAGILIGFGSGLCIGVFFIIIAGGFFAILLNIDEKLNEISNKISEMKVNKD